MTDQYIPSALVAKLAAALMGKAIAEHVYSDGHIVIVFEDGRKLTLDKDDIARTLSAPSMDSEHPVSKEIEDAAGEQAHTPTNRPRKHKGESAHE